MNKPKRMSAMRDGETEKRMSASRTSKLDSSRASKLESMLRGGDSASKRVAKVDENDEEGCANPRYAGY